MHDPRKDPSISSPRSVKYEWPIIPLTVKTHLPRPAAACDLVLAVLVRQQLCRCATPCQNAPAQGLGTADHAKPPLTMPKTLPRLIDGGKPGQLMPNHDLVDSGVARPGRPSVPWARSGKKEEKTMSTSHSDSIIVSGVSCRPRHDWRWILKGATGDAR
jgi:hypothetical protein